MLSKLQKLQRLKRIAGLAARPDIRRSKHHPAGTNRVHFRSGCLPEVWSGLLQLARPAQFHCAIAETWDNDDLERPLDFRDSTDLAVDFDLP